ncbi:MAG: fumarate hydratase [Candidatus Izimaplasma sp.]|nr:fumarate hydratase [Candidatus Izimaplasma bacterium]
MREIDAKEVTNIIRETVIEINYHLDQSLFQLLQKAKQKEASEVASSILDDILENAKIADTNQAPLCQDTGVVVVFLEIGQDVHIIGNLEDAINQGVREGYQKGYLRKSMVSHPFERKNTQDNTPAIIHTKLVAGSEIKLKIAAKGGGSENMSIVKMLTPAEGLDGIKKLVLDTVFNAGGKPCPPIIVGLGIGGNFEKSALLAKEALLRALDDHNSDPVLAKLEQDLLKDINKLGVGPMGVGGETTCLAVKVNAFPMHIASLPVAINIQCHSSRHKEVVL